MSPPSPWPEFFQRIALPFQENAPIAPYTTVRVGGPARWLLFPKNADQLAALLRFHQEEYPACPLLLLGGGANCFVDSKGFDGLVINLRRWDEDISIQEKRLSCGGGLDMGRVAEAATRAGLGGLDFMAVVPGTVGGAVVINAGTHTEGYVADCLVEVETLDSGGALHRYDGAELAFAYRQSALIGKREIVTRAVFELPTLESLGLNEAAQFARFKESLAVRRAKFPLQWPNFGSTFRSPGRPYPPAGKLLDDLGMKGTRLGQAQISEKHANFIVNVGGATSADILGLMEKMQAVVEKAHGIRLRPEVHYIPAPGSPMPPLYDA